MQNLREDLVADLFRTGAIRAFALEVRDGHANIVYTMLDGTKGVVHTKRGEAKEYRLETALRLLRSLGLVAVTVEMSGWSLDQKSLL